MRDPITFSVPADELDGSRPHGQVGGPDAGVVPARTNAIEARAVVDRVLFHRQTHPDLTLGVVAFSSAQESALAAALEHQALDHPELNELLSSDRLDGFFVKNLENVQGDERDIIVFSIGYGPDENGKFTENLGPLNKQD